MQIFLCVAVLYGLQSFALPFFCALQFFRLRCTVFSALQFFCIAVFLRCSFFRIAFFCIAVGPGHAHMTPWLITHNLIYVAAADDDVDVVLSSNIFRQIFTRGEKVSITT